MSAIAKSSQRIMKQRMENKTLRSGTERGKNSLKTSMPKAKKPGKTVTSTKSKSMKTTTPDLPSK